MVFERANKKAIGSALKMCHVNGECELLHAIRASQPPSESQIRRVHTYHREGRRTSRICRRIVCWTFPKTQYSGISYCLARTWGIRCAVYGACTRTKTPPWGIIYGLKYFVRYFQSNTCGRCEFSRFFIMIDQSCSRQPSDKYSKLRPPSSRLSLLYPRP